MSPALLDHLWQSSLVALMAAALTLTVRRNGARVRFWLWFAASIKFLLPFAGLAALGGWLSRLCPQALPLNIAPAIPLAAPARLLPVARDTLDLAPWLLGLWVLGLAAVMGVRLLRWLRLRALLADARELRRQPLPVKTCGSLLEPGLVGILHPVVVLPAGLLPHLSAGEIESILAHERAHLARRDNLTAMLHMLVEALFWFWPPVWLIGARMIAERERACDESVVEAGHDPLTYAQSILKVCRFCIQSPLACVAGASGSHLGRRMERIMAGEGARDLDGAHILLLGGAALMAVGLPVLAGFAGAPLAEVTRGAARMQARLQQAMAAPLAAVLSPQADDMVRVVRATHAAKPRLAVPAPGDSDPPPVTQAAAPQAAPAPEPFTILPTGPAAQESAAQGVKEAVLAITPSGTGDPDAITCRVAQPLPGSRLPGPEVCKVNRIWAELRGQGREIAADGHHLVVKDEAQRRRILAAGNCNQIVGGSAVINAISLPTYFCS